MEREVQRCSLHKTETSTVVTERIGTDVLRLSVHVVFALVRCIADLNGGNVEQVLS